ncbi:MAG: mechanosensitive ion channel family protein [Candidatus Electrothrix sp. AR3]|nr:mechanosensitive ion channel family protein [Candidatus Electrothrix sp. AR3]
MRSRSYGENVPWFPTRQGDWVFLADGTYGQVEIQAPDIVQIKKQSGYKFYTPSAFLKQHPFNLSMNLFTVNKMLNLDLRHTDIAIADVKDKIKQMLQEAIEQQPYGKYLKKLTVELKDIGDYSLDIGTGALFSGEAASNYFEIGWLQQNVALEACKRYGWQIALQQVTVHQAKPYELMQMNQG